MKARISQGRGARVQRARGDRGKLLVAVGLFALAGGMLAWYYGLVPGVGVQEAQPPLTPQQEADVLASQRAMEAELRKPGVTINGS